MADEIRGPVLPDPEATVQAIPSVGVVRDAITAWTGEGIKRLAEAGYTNEQIMGDDVSAAIRQGAVDFAFKAMGPGTDVNYDNDILAQMLREIGFADIVPERQIGPEYLLGMIQQAKAERPSQRTLDAIAEIKSDPNEEAGFLQRLGNWFGRQIIEQNVPYAAIDATTPREIPSRVSTAIKVMEEIPFTNIDNPAFDPVAAKIPGLVTEATALRIPGYNLVGVDTAVKYGINPVVADIVAETILDPLAHDPMIAFGALTVGARAGFGAHRLARASLRNGRRVFGPELLDEWKRLGGVMERELLAAPNTPYFGAEDIIAVGKLQRSSVASKGFQEAGELIFNVRNIAKGRMEADAEFLDIVRSLHDSKHHAAARELLDMRVMMTTDEFELGRLQRMAADKLGKNFDVDIMRRPDMGELFLNNSTGKIERVEAGLMSEFVQDPTKFSTKSGLLTKSKEGQVIRRVLGIGPQEAVTMDDLQQRVGSLRFVGRGRAAVDASSGIEWLAKNAPEIFKRVGGGTSFLSRWARTASSQLSGTPVFQPLVLARNAMNTMRGEYTMRLHEALGGEVYKIGDSLTELMVTNGTGYKVGRTGTFGLFGRSPLMPPERSVFSPMKLFDKARKAKALKINDELRWLLGSDLEKQSVNAARAKRGLSEITAITDPERLAQARQVRLLLDELGEEAARWNIIDPATLISDYLPRIRERMNAGDTLEQAINASIGKDKAALLKSKPFFAMARMSSDPEGLLTSIPEMLDVYTRSLARQKFLKPIANELIDVVMSPRSALSDNDKMIALDFIHHQLGGRTRFTANLSSKMDENIQHLRGLIDDPNYQALDQNWVQKGIASLAYNITDLWYTHYIGFKGLKAARNLTQQALASPFAGDANFGKHYLRGRTRMQFDRGLKDLYLERARAWNWHNDTYEFAKDQMDWFMANAPQGRLLSNTYRQAAMGLYQLSDMENRMATWAASFDYVDEMLKTGNTRALGKASRGFSGQERGTIMSLIERGEYERAKWMWADAAVNNSQWLYNARNRPTSLQKAIQSGDPIAPLAGMLNVFMTWPLNFGVVGHRMLTGRGLEQGAQRLNAAQHMVNATEGALKWLGPTALLGGGLHVGAKATGFPADPSRWLLPESEDVFGGTGGKTVKSWVGMDPEDDLILELPIVGLGSLLRVMNDPASAGEMMPLQQLASDWAALTQSAVGVLNGEDPDAQQKRAVAIQQFFSIVPLTPQGLQPLNTWAGEQLGIDPDVEYREGIFQELMGGILQMREDPNWWQSQGMRPFSEDGDSALSIEKFLELIGGRQ